MNELAKAAHLEEHEELSDEALSQVEQDKLEDDIAFLIAETAVTLSRRYRLRDLETEHLKRSRAPDLCHSGSLCLAGLMSCVTHHHVPNLMPWPRGC